MPKRIQRKRTRGFRLPPNTVCINRPGRFGNPFKIGDTYRDDNNQTQIITREVCLELFRVHAKAKLAADPHWLDPIRDADYIACFCPETEPCHGDIYLELLANHNSRECLHCSYIGKRKVKLCEECLALWMKENNIPTDGVTVITHRARRGANS